MTIVKTCELTGKALDWAVAKCETGCEPELFYGSVWVVTGGFFARIRRTVFAPSTDWAQGGPIIERGLIATIPAWHNAGYDSPTGYWEWAAYILGPDNLDDNHEQRGPTPLIAAMRCYVTSKLGDTVEIPNELLE